MTLLMTSLCSRQSLYVKLVAKGVKSTMELAAIYRLPEDGVPGASLSRKSPDVLSVEQLKRWLACRSGRRSGIKAEFVQQ